MENRFLGMSDYLKRIAALDPGLHSIARGRPQPATLPRGGAQAPALHGMPGGGLPIFARPQSALFAMPLAAQDRALVILIENGGIDLGIPTLVEKILEAVPGAGLIPGAHRQALVRTIGDKIRSVTDNLLESAELSVNRYAASRPEFFGDVIVLRDGTSSYDDLKSTLIAQSRAGKVIDVIILTHGREDTIAVAGGVTGRKIEAMKAELGGPLAIRSVYMMNCVGASLNQAWLKAGARVSAGSVKNNYLPEPTTFFFWKAWKEGHSFEESVTSAYRKTINLMNDAVRSAVSALPIPGSDLLAQQIDFSHMEFVRDSAPFIEGQQSLTINSDNLSTPQSLPSGFGTTVWPAALLRSLSESAAALPPSRRTQGLSAAGLEFLKQWEGFRDRLGTDMEGQCTVGYGSVLHSGSCDGRPIEEPYAAGITRDTAAQLLAETCGELRQFLDESLTTTLNQNQSDALISFVHNVGGEAFRASTLLNVLNAGDVIAAAREMRKWTKAARNGGVIEVPELVKRREAEAQLFERPVAMAQSLSLPHPRLFGHAFSAVDYSVPGTLPIVAQPTPRTCWAAVMTMMYSWRHGVSIAVRDALARIGTTYVDMFNRDVTLDSNSAPPLYRDAGLSTITSFNPTIEGWDLLLRKYGPLYVDVGYNTGNVTHAIIVTGIRGDGSADGTSITYIDPIGGNTITRKFSDFLTSYEATSAVQWPYVIVHWPAGAHASAQQSFARTHSYSFHSPSLVTAQSRFSSAQNLPAIVAGIEIADAVQIGLAAAAIVQTQVAASQGTFSLSYDKAQRLLLPEARSQMPGSQSSKQRYWKLLFHLGIGRLGTAKADVIIEWEGNPYGEIGRPIIRRNLSSSTEWSKSAANITITKVDRIPLPRTDPRTWPIVYTYEGTYDPLMNGYFEFSGEFELNAFGGLKFNRHEVVSRSMADWALSGTPEGKVQRGADVVVPVPDIPEEQVTYLRTRLP